MAAKKKSPPELLSAEEFFRPPRMLPVKKIRRVLKAIDADPTRFAKAYQKDRIRRDGPRPPTDEEIKAVAAYQKTGDKAALMAALDVSAQAASAAVDRVIAFRAKK